MLASLLISLGRKRLKLDPKYKPLRFIRPRLTVSMFWNVKGVILIRKTLRKKDNLLTDYEEPEDNKGP